MLDKLQQQQPFSQAAFIVESKHIGTDDAITTTYVWIVRRCRKQRQRSRAVADTTQVSEAETAGAAERAAGIII